MGTKADAPHAWTATRQWRPHCLTGAARSVGVTMRPAVDRAQWVRCHDCGIALTHGDWAVFGAEGTSSICPRDAIRRGLLAAPAPD